MKHLEPGSQVSHYRIERQIGVGGMGAVFLAQDLTLDRPVAIKFLTAQNDERSRKRLLREAQAAAALDHECIAAVYEVDTDPVGGDFIVMQYVEGETLATRLKRGRLSEAEAFSITGRVTEALVVAHRRGVIHRDLKPHNIIITPGGTPKLLDFGLATRAVELPPDAETETSGPTGTHSVTGTPAYMAPEQIRNQTIDARSDVFALGCVLYECLTGRRAFTGKTSAEVFGNVLHVEPAPVSSIVPELGASHDALCARLLKKKPSERYQSAEEVLGALHAFADTAQLASSQSAKFDTRSWQSLRVRLESGSWVRWAMLAAAAVVVIAGGSSLWRWYRGAVLPKPTVDAARYYARGIEALRDGTYAKARDSFQEALKHFESYVQAYSGLAQAHMELDDETGARDAMLKVHQLVPNRTRLPTDERLRLEGILASVTRAHDQAIAAYAELVERHGQDVGAWLDLGRAKEAAERRTEARADYEKALALDAQSPAAHMRLGLMQVHEGRKNEAVANYDEAMRLYRLAGNTEGEIEGLLRKGAALNNAVELPAATVALQEAVRLAGDRYLLQRVQAQFQLARVAAQRSRPTDAIAPTEAAVLEAKNAGLYSSAADGLVDLANLFVETDLTRAEAILAEAMQLAADHGARRAQMRAQLQRVFLLSRQGKAKEAIAMAAGPLAYYGEGRYPVLEAVAKTVVARTKEALGEFDEAIRLSSDVLRLADTMGDLALATDALQNLAFQYSQVGRLPEALVALERSADIYRRSRQFTFLGSTLMPQAEMLILLGRSKDVEAPLAELERGIADKSDTNVARPRRVARLRALLAVTEGRFADVGTHVAQTRVEKGGKPDATDLYGRVFKEYADAHLSRSRTPSATIAGWPAEASSPETRRELTYWVAQTLRARRENARAHELAQAAWAELAGQANPELRWRLAAVAILSAGAAPAQNGVTIPPRSAEEDVQKLKALWSGYDSTAYFNRADLKALPGNRSQ